MIVVYKKILFLLLHDMMMLFLIVHVIGFIKVVNMMCNTHVLLLREL